MWSKWHNFDTKYFKWAVINRDLRSSTCKLQYLVHLFVFIHLTWYLWRWILFWYRHFFGNYWKEGDTASLVGVNTCLYFEWSALSKTIKGYIKDNPSYMKVNPREKTFAPQVGNSCFCTFCLMVRVNRNYRWVFNCFPCTFIPEHS